MRTSWARRTDCSRTAASDDGQVAADLVFPASGHQGDEGPGRIQPAVPEKFVPAAPDPKTLEQGMPDVTMGDARPGVDSLFEGEDEEHFADDAFDRLQAAFSPGPNGRADIIKDGDAGLNQPPGQAEVEIGGIDQDGRGRTAGRGLGRQPPEDLPDAGNVLDDFGQAHHRQAVHRDEDIHPGVGHVRSPDAEELGPGIEQPEFADETRAVIFPGFLSGHDEDRRITHFNGVPNRMISGFCPGVRPKKNSQVS